jgi:hypothetical protein
MHTNSFFFISGVDQILKNTYTSSATVNVGPLAQLVEQ